MFYSLVNLEGKTLDTFRDDDLAHAALRAVVHANPSLIDEVLVLRNDDDGEIAGDSLMYEDLPTTGAKMAYTATTIDVLAQHQPAAAVGYYVGRSRPRIAAPPTRVVA
jgi:hypothetical protein